MTILSTTSKILRNCFNSCFLAPPGLPNVRLPAEPVTARATLRAELWTEQ